MNDRGVENRFLYARASASTLAPVPLALILCHIKLCGRDFPRYFLIVMGVCAVSVTS